MNLVILITLHFYPAVVLLHLGKPWHRHATGKLSSEQHRDSEDWRHQNLDLGSFCLSSQNNIERVGEVEKSAIKMCSVRWCGSNTTAARPQQEEEKENTAGLGRAEGKILFYRARKAQVQESPCCAEQTAGFL